MFKNMRLVIFFGMFLNPSFKMTAIELQLAEIDLYTRKDFKSSGTVSLYEK